MEKQLIFQQEYEKLSEVFKEIEAPNRQLIEGLIKDAAFLYAEDAVLKESIGKTGMIKVHPQHPELQKPTEAAKQYLKNVNSYAVVIKALNSVLNKNALEPDDDDDLDEYK